MKFDINVKLEDGCLLDVVPCSLIEITYISEGLAASIIRVRTHPSDDGGSKHLSNVSKLVPYYMAQHPRRQSFSYSLP
jgi:hypothetical protein